MITEMSDASVAVSDQSWKSRTYSGASVENGTAAISDRRQWLRDGYLCFEMLFAGLVWCCATRLFPIGFGYD